MPVEFKGRIAFCPIIDPTDDSGFGIGVAEENERGYRPYRGLSFHTHEDAQATASMMNERLGLSEREAALIIASTMRSDRSERRRLERARQGKGAA